MATVIDTGKVTGRRSLHFNSLDDIRADVEMLARSQDLKTLGNWSAGQIFWHLATVMKGSLDGIPPMMPGFVRAILRLLFKRRFLTKPMAAGFKLPAKAVSIIPPPTSFADGLQFIRQQLDRLQAETKREPSPVLGALTREEWDQLHCRHAELHLSFLVPSPA